MHDRWKTEMKDENLDCACDVALCYYLKKLDCKFIIEDELFYHCNYLGKPCHDGFKEDIIACHSMSISDFEPSHIFDLVNDIVHEENNEQVQEARHEGFQHWSEISNQKLINGIMEKTQLIQIVKQWVTVDAEIKELQKQQNIRKIEKKNTIFHDIININALILS
jgi:hypothetical protein